MSAKAAFTIVEDPASTRRIRNRCLFWFIHESFLPAKTETGDPSAMHAETGWRSRMRPISGPYNAAPSPTKLAAVHAHTFQRTWVTSYSRQSRPRAE
jgi:hypothetical protein